MVFRALVLGLALLVGAEGVNVIASECPKNGPRNETVQIPHETDCTKYYTCLGQTKLERDCPFMDGDGNRLHFNPQLHQCDWPSDAGCENSSLLKKIIKNTRFALKSPPTHCPRVDPKYETVHLAHETDCTKFYKCLQGHKIEMSCPKDKFGNRLYFNPELQVCDWPFNVDCS